MTTHQNEQRQQDQRAGFPEELTPAGVQLLIPGCERTPPKTDKPQQLGLW